jgi:hypothetical protein
MPVSVIRLKSLITRLTGKRYPSSNWIFAEMAEALNLHFVSDHFKTGSRPIVLSFLSMKIQMPRKKSVLRQPRALAFPMVAYKS